MPLYLGLYAAQSLDWGKILFDSTCSSWGPWRGLKSLSDFCRLQVQWASCILLRSLGCPPLATGIMWSTQGESGWGYLRSLSTGFPQIPHTVCVSMIFLRFLSAWVRCVPSLSGLFRF